jgi:hypothetical protein
MIGPIRIRGHVSNYYTRAFFPAQLAIGLICWLTYTAAAPDLGPVATVFIVMQVSAVIASMWANRVRRRMTSVTSRLIN